MVTVKIKSFNHLFLLYTTLKFGQVKSVELLQHPEKLN